MALAAAGAAAAGADATVPPVPPAAACLAGATGAAGDAADAADAAGCDLAGTGDPLAFSAADAAASARPRLLGGCCGLELPRLSSPLVELRPRFRVSTPASSFAARREERLATGSALLPLMLPMHCAAAQGAVKTEMHQKARTEQHDRADQLTMCQELTLQLNPYSLSPSSIQIISSTLLWPAETTKLESSPRKLLYRIVYGTVGSFS